MVKKIIFVVAGLAVLAGVGFFAVRYFTNNDIESVMFDDFESSSAMSNDGVTSDLDDIFSETITEDDKIFLDKTLDNTDENVIYEKTLDVSKPKKVDALIVKKIPNVSRPKKVDLVVDPAMTNEKKIILDSAYQGQYENQSVYTSSISTDKPKIASFILNYNRSLTATKRNPMFITLVVKAPEEALFTSIRVYARRLSNNNKILSRTLVFSLPKIYVVNGQAQTQFYFNGRTSANKFLPKGRYLLYAEAQVVDAKGNSVGNTGRYALPKWQQVITIR